MTKTKNKLRGIFIDIDDTITDTQTLYHEAIDICHEVFNKLTNQDLSKNEFKKLYSKARRAVKNLVPSSAAQHNRAIYFQRMLEDFSDDTDFNAINQLYEAYYIHIYNNMKLYPGMLEMFQWAEEKKIIVGAVSDGNSHIRLKKIKALGISDYLDFLVSSEEVGADKPNNQIYLLALNKSGLNKDQVVYIGNRASSDILGANTVGITSVRFSIRNPVKDRPKNKKEEADYNVDNPEELHKLLAKLHKTGIK